MKNIRFYFMLLSFLILLSCKKNDNVENINCSLFADALINLQQENVKMEIDKLVVDLNPRVSENDKFGQSQNLNLLIERLNSQCDNVEATLICYSCIYTLPPQSEIAISIDSSGIEITRTIDILTPEDEALSCLRVY